jgi:hypothetical protein
LSDDLPEWVKALGSFFFGLASNQALKDKGINPQPGTSHFGMLPISGTLYSLDQDIQERVSKLMSLQEEAVNNPAWKAHDITGDGKAETFCNRASSFLAQGFGYYGLRIDQYASSMIAGLASDPRWREDSIDRAHTAAMRGGLAFLTLLDQPHAHLCSVAPLPKEFSGSWNELVPIVANIGPLQDSGFVRASKAFRTADKPRIRAFILTESVA